MPDISTPYAFTSAEKTLIQTKAADPTFKHTSWSEDELAGIRKNLRDHYRLEQVAVCCYCRNTVSLRSANNSHVEHIAPKSLYLDFIFHPKNICVICTDCNEIKRNQEVLNEMPDTLNDGSGRKKYPHASNSFKIVHPHIDEYAKHIVQVGKLYVNLTKKGHFTIGACGLNRYVEKFGWQTELVDKAEISMMMNTFLQSTDPADQRDLLFALQQKLMKVNL